MWPTRAHRVEVIEVVRLTGCDSVAVPKSLKMDAIHTVIVDNNNDAILHQLNMYDYRFLFCEQDAIKIVHSKCTKHTNMTEPFTSRSMYFVKHPVHVYVDRH